MQIIKKTKDFIVVQNNQGIFQTIPNNEISDFIEALTVIQDMNPGSVDGRRGECMSKTIEG